MQVVLTQDAEDDVLDEVDTLQRRGLDHGIACALVAERHGFEGESLEREAWSAALRKHGMLKIPC